jgi:hypothetical protein
MANLPTCSLCSGRLAKVENVSVGVSLCYKWAWVCTQCSAAFPIALNRTWIGIGNRPMYDDGAPADKA